MNVKKANTLVDLIEGSFSLVAILSLVVLTFITVSALNPKIVPAQDNTQQVAGISTDNSEDLPLQLTNLASEDKTHLDQKVEDGILKGDYLAYSNGVDAGQTDQDFISVKNISDKPLKFSIGANFESGQTSDLQISLVSNNGTVTLYNAATENLPKNISIDSLETKNFRIRYTANKDVHSPFSVRYKIAQIL